MTMKRFWVFIEQEEGNVHPVSWELLGVASRLAEDVREEAQANGDEVIVEGVLLGDHIEDIAQTAIHYGAQNVYVMDSPIFKKYRNQPYYQSIVTMTEKYKPEVFLIGATTLGRDLAGAVATSLKTGLTADCTQLEMGEVKGVDHKLLLATRPAFGGNVIATIVCRKSLPQMASVRPRVFSMADMNSQAKGNIIHEMVEILEKDINSTIIDLLEDQKENANIEYADVIVSGGRGLGTPEGFALLEELAAVLGAVVGTTRPCVDAGWINYSHQVGQTGKTVRPKLYIAAGISGALQHKVGILNSDFIIAINKDTKAPIFEVAHIGIVGDLYEIIPAMIKQIKERKEALA